ncbi:MAG: phosphoribosylaminoimidazolesuccinocarboxamide synthase, partial [Nitrosopumilaceae archaeon]
MNKKIDLTMINQGKVRDIYEIPNRDLLLIHTTDRISAFDVVLPNLIPQKGEVLNQVSLFWFDKTKAIIDNHIEEPQAYLQNTYAPLHSCETMVVKKLTPLPIEAVIRGYMAGSGWRDYEKTGEVCGVPLPGGLMKGSRLPTPIFTPATKAPIGEHDENITFEDAKLILTSSLAEYIREISIQLYDFISDYALRRGIILADTKFEFGTDNGGNVY